MLLISTIAFPYSVHRNQYDVTLVGELINVSTIY